MPHFLRQLIVLIGGLLVLSTGRATPAAPLSDSAFRGLVRQYCIDCHNTATHEGSFNLELIVTEAVSANTLNWEKVVRRITTRQMPPIDADRPGESGYRALSQYLISRLDAAAIGRSVPGYVSTIRRLNRTEYRNAIRDLLAVEIAVDDLLPADESSHGFDHITVDDLSPALVTRYVQAAQKIARLAVGSPLERPDAKIFRIPADVTQESHVPGLPLGTRGGGLFRHTFQRGGEYEVQIRLMRDRNDEVEGLHAAHQLEILLDGKRMAGIVVEPPDSGKLADFDDSRLRARISVPAGPHGLGVTFVRRGGSLEETRRQPLNVHFNLHRHPRLNPAIYEVSISGPFAAGEPVDEAEETPSRRRIFIARPGDDFDAESAAREVLRSLARRGYRREVRAADLDRLMEFFREGNERAGFEAGIESAIAALLTSPHFLMKVERSPEGLAAGEAYRVSDFELASRLSFFLWSSIPDEELLELAGAGDLRKPEVLERQVKRMLADGKAANLATNFAGQWLHLRNLDSITPDGRLYPDFDENLRRAMRRETQLHLQDIVSQDHSVLNLIRADHTWLNERLARHYGIPHVYGSRFRRVELPTGSRRGGLLRHGSILTVTSNATRTSPVIRGNWVLENILGSPAPPPPEDVPSLDDRKLLSAHLTVRARLEQHRADPTCAHCHNLMDPVGFALENFDVVGQWRDRDGDEPVDVSGGLPDGSRFSGVTGLESAILKRPELFVTTMTVKLMTFAVGRGVELQDGPVIRHIVRQAAEQDYRFSALVLGIVRSAPFQMRTTR